MAKQTVEKVQEKLKVGVEKVIADVKELVATAKEGFVDLKAEAAASGVGNTVADAVVPYLPLPWYVPSWVAKGIIKDAVDKAIAKAIKSRNK